MNKDTLYIFLTQNGALFDRTNGKNERIMFGKEYVVANCKIVFSKDDDGKVEVKHFNAGGTKVTEMTTSGLYVVAPLFVLPFPKKSKVVRNLYNKIKDILSKPRFEIIEEETFDDPFKIQFVARSEGNIIETKYIIRVNPDMVCNDDVSAVAKIIEGAEKAVEHDFRSFFGDKMIGNNEAVTITIDDEYLDVKP